MKGGDLHAPNQRFEEKAMTTTIKNGAIVATFCA
jgi:hypothetical protein